MQSHLVGDTRRPGRVYGRDVGRSPLAALFRFQNHKYDNKDKNNQAKRRVPQAGQAHTATEAAAAAPITVAERAAPVTSARRAAPVAVAAEKAGIGRPRIETGAGMGGGNEHDQGH